VRQDARPDKRLYRITPEGSEALREWLERAPLEPDAERILLIKLFFARHADPEVMCGFVREFRAKAERLALDLAEIEANVAGGGDRFRAMTRTYGLAAAAAAIDWAHSVEEELA
jgi:PadR family transcriptional regulator, regulatory protein AphA